jgi:hypothetical protein
VAGASIGSVSPSPRATSQLRALAHLSRTLEQHAVDYWLFGGWAVDFWVGSITREHQDIDVAARRADYGAIRATLVGAGWRHSPTSDEDEGTVYQWRGVQVEFTFIADDDGPVTLTLNGEPVVWSTEPFGHARRRLRGIECRIIPLEILRSGKQTPREDDVEAAKDHADWHQLSRIH